MCILFGIQFSMPPVSTCVDMKEKSSHHKHASEHQLREFQEKLRRQRSELERKHEFVLATRLSKQQTEYEKQNETNLQTQKNHFEQEITAMKKELNYWYQNNLTEKQNEIHTLNHKLNQSNQECDKIKHSFESKIEKISNELDNKNDNIVQIQKDIADAIKLWNQNGEQMRSELLNRWLPNKKYQSNERLAEIEKHSLRSMETQITLIKNRAKDILDNEFSKYKEAISELEHFQEKLDAKNVKISQYESEIQTLKSQVDSQTMEIDHMRVDHQVCLKLHS